MRAVVVALTLAARALQGGAPEAALDDAAGDRPEAAPDDATRDERPEGEAAEEGADGAMASARASTPVRVDGRLDEPDWRAAPAFADFVELFPRAGATPADATEVRFLHDDATLYVGITCHDAHPQSIVRPLARRDDVPPGDSVLVAIDPRHDHRTAYAFVVGAGGVLEDRLLYDDTEETSEWDAVWDGAAATTAGGWSAELAIPLSALRLRGSAPRTLGVYVERKVGRTHEVVASVLIPPNAGAFVSRFGHLRLGTVAPPRGVELAPFVASRAVLRPQFSDPTRPAPRLVDPSVDVGLDLRAPLGEGLTLTGTVNPDFGQVEADPVILNLTRFEPFFPEKRPFFLQDMALFQPVLGKGTPQQILYTRRIGLDAPILAAGKITGAAAERLDVGLLDAVVTGAGSPQDEARPDRRVRFHLAQPFRVGPNSALPLEPPEPTNFFAATVRRSLGETSSAGLRLAAATPLGQDCSAADETLDPPPPRCRTGGGNAAAAELALRSPGGDWSLTTQLAGSQVVGGPAARTLLDGTSLRRGAVGAGATAVLGKTGGEPIQAELDLEYAAPTLELNAAGFQPDSNLAAISPTVRFVRADGLGPLRSLSLGLSGRAEWSADERRLLREASVGADLAVLLPGFNDLRCSAEVQGWAWDLREVVGTGIAYERPAAASFGCDLTTNRHRPLALQLGAGATRFETAGLLDGAGTWGGSGQVAAFVRPARRFELRAGVKLEQEIVPGRFIDEGDDGTLRLGDLLSRSLTVKLRQELLLSRELSVQLYAELFSALGRYRALYRAARPADGRLYARALEPLPAPDEPLDFRLSSLRVNAVLRWEYRRGSTLFLVYTRQQDADRQVDPRERLELGFRALGVAPAVDVFLVKLSIWTVH